ncbi:hypothetical protein Nmel_017291 [Mimus melanotis]
MASTRRGTGTGNPGTRSSLTWWKMISSGPDPGIKSCMNVKPTCQTGGGIVDIKSCTLKNLTQTVINRKEMNKMLSMGRRDPTRGSKRPVSPTKGKKPKNPTRRSRKSAHTKRERKRKRSRRELPQIPPGERARAQERRLQAPGKENTSARKNPGKCLPRNLPLLLGRRVTFPMQAAPAPAALRTLNPRGKRRNGPQGRERSGTTRRRRGRVRCQRRGARGRTGRWRGMRNLRTALMRTEGSGCSSEQEGRTEAGLSLSTAPLLQHWFTHTMPAHREYRAWQSGCPRAHRAAEQDSTYILPASESLAVIRLGFFVNYVGTDCSFGSPKQWPVGERTG